MLPVLLLKRRVRGWAGTEYARFLGGSALCGAINVAILVGGDRLGLGYVVLSLLAYAVSGTTGYLYHSAITFRRPARWIDYLRFLGGLLLGLPVWLILMAILRDVLALPMWIAAPSATALMLVYHFLSARFAILWRLRA